MIKVKATLVICCTDRLCNYGVGVSGNTVEVLGLLSISQVLEIDSVPNDQTVTAHEFDLPTGWQANYNYTDFRCPEHHETGASWV